MENNSIAERRRAYLAYLFEEHKLDAIVISKPTHIRYLTGFTGSNGQLLLTRRTMYLLTDSRYESQAQDEVENCKIVIASKGLFEEIKRRNYLRKAKRVGFESNHITVEEQRRLKRTLPTSRLVALDVSIEPIMLQKEQYEIDNIKRAVEISELVFHAVLGSIKPGVTEREIAAELIYLHRRYGADHDSFEPIVASGYRAALPHARPSGKQIKNNEILLIDFGCVFNGYNSDITRTIAVGDVGSEARKVHAVVREALERVLETARDGVSCKTLDGIARNVITKAGYGNLFRHSLGHGIGLDVHELPRISSQSTERLVSRSTVTLEPGVYVPDHFGVRIEDDVLITESGCEPLTSLTRELIVV